ncbi:site-specific integrase [Cognatilysobacter terrigena]|uniref:site-specific integrase n=1 Tax=Cognatilysobacter terrigena TaxID=2488749 RepID=UPI001061AC4F|nr:site-specific integrase [Lysobacter terrigena]
MAEYLQKRKGSTFWYARVPAPREVLELRAEKGVKGRREVWQTLGTRDLREAKQRLPHAIIQIQAAFAAEVASLRHKPAQSSIVPTEEDFQRAVWEFVKRERALDELERTVRPSGREVQSSEEALQLSFVANPPSSELEALSRSLTVIGMREAAQTASENRAALRDALKTSLINNDFEMIDWAIQDLVERKSWRIEADSVAYKTLGRHLIKAWLNALATAERRDEGIYEDLPVAPAGLAEPTVPSRSERRDVLPFAKKPKKGESLKDYFEAYLKEARSGVTSGGLKEARATIRQFVESVGDRPVDAYRRDDMARFKRLLREAPVLSEKRFPGVGLPQAIELNKKANHPVIKASTARCRLSIMSSFGKWLELNVDGVDASSFQTSLPPRTDSERMEPFSQDEVRRILNAHAFIGCESEQNQLPPGEHRIRDWRYWLTLILAFSGARLNEITQLTVADITERDGIPGFAITDRAAGQSLKNANSKRWIPIHPKLLELGILDYVAAVGESGEYDLFHDIALDRDGRRSKSAGKWFTRFLTRIGVKGESDLGAAHRWRHTLTDSLRRAGVDDYDISVVLGHGIDAAKMTQHYGREIVFKPADLHRLLSKAAYPTVDFELLR